MLKSSSLCLYSSNLGTFWLKIKQFWPFEEISIFSNGGHLGWRVGLSDTNLKGTHRCQVSLNLVQRFQRRRFKCDLLSKFHPPFFLFLAWQPSWLEVGITGHNFGRGPSKDHSTKVWLQLAQWFLRRRLKCEMLTDGRQTTDEK